MPSNASSRRTLTAAGLLLSLAAAVLVEGCGEGARNPPAAPVAAKLSAEQEFAALSQRAAAGDIQAQDSLGTSYALGSGVPKDTVKAVEWLSKAAARGDSAAQFKLGFMYHTGQGVARDSAKAIAWYEKAATQQNVQAQFNLGSMYASGDDLPRDSAKAGKWWQKAAAQGYAAAQLKLGGAYFYGDGVPRDLVLAYAWLNLAARRESTKIDAVQKRSLLERLMTPEEIAEAQRLSSGWVKKQILAR